MSEFDSYRPHYESEIDHVIRLGGRSREFYTKAKANALLELFSGDITGAGPLNVLDVGCGGAAIHGFLLSSSLPLKLTGVDMSRTFLESAQAEHPDVRYDVCDGERLPYEDATFDSAYAICVLHHVPPARWLNFVGEMRRVVRPGGRVTILEHNPLNPLTNYVVKSCQFDRDAILLGSRRTRQVMRNAGIHELSCSYILFSPFEGRLFRRFDRMMGWLPLGAQYVVSGRVLRD
jgi:SAM-dependent methyltransferase